MISQIGPISRIRLISRIGQIGVISIQKAQTSVDYSLTEAFALPFGLNKQQETYADMTTHYA